MGRVGAKEGERRRAGAAAAQTGRGRSGPERRMGRGEGENEMGRRGKIGLRRGGPSEGVGFPFSFSYFVFLSCFIILYFCFMVFRGVVFS